MCMARCGQITRHWHNSLCAVGDCRAVTFRLCLLTVGRDDDALQLPELEVFQDLPQPQHEPPFCLGLDRILLVHAVLEAHQLLEQTRDTSIYFFTKHLAAVAERHPRDREFRQHQTKATDTPALTGPCNSLCHKGGTAWEALPCTPCAGPIALLLCVTLSAHRHLDSCPEEPCGREGMSTADCS